MLVPHRTFSSPEYRYGFQGQEKDDEVKGNGNSLNYKYRMHDPRVGRFFAVDPLIKEYPHYTPYSFSGNKVIAHREIEGMEDLSIHVANPATPNRPGNATITITMAHKVVTQGAGELHNRTSISPSNYTAAYDTGDTTLYSTNLPSQTQSANFLSGKQEKWARKAVNSRKPRTRKKYNRKLAKAGISSFYEVNVDYSYTISSIPNTTLNDAVNWTSNNVSGRGIIFNPETTLRSSVGRTNYNLNRSIYSSIFTVNNMGLSLSNNEGAVGLSSGMLGGSHPSLNYNFVAGNPSFFGAGSTYSFSLNPTKVLIHEVGHNNAAVNLHGSGGYEYNQNGTQSNTNPKPSRQNTKDIINDSTNRKSL